jgi:hypothetical protein
MKKHVRLIAMMLSLITVLLSVVSCAETVEEADTTVADAETNAPAGEVVTTEAETTAEETLFAPDDLKEKYDFNETITILMWSDYRMTEFYAEENGDLIADSIYHRNIKVSDRLGITLEFVEEPGDSGDYKQWIQKAENDRAADNDYDIYEVIELHLYQLEYPTVQANHLNAFEDIVQLQTLLMQPWNLRLIYVQNGYHIDFLPN